MAQKLVVRSGAWFKYGETHLGQGREKVRAYLQENPAVVEELRQRILSAGVAAVSTTTSSDGAESE
jgi:recombination protein RecA